MRVWIGEILELCSLYEAKRLDGPDVDIVAAAD
jgi:hypothetical protein